MASITYTHSWTPGTYSQSLLDNLINVLGAQTGQPPVDTAVQISPDGSTAFVTVDDSIDAATVIAAISRSCQLITAGEIRLGNFPTQPGSGLFCGIRIAYPALEYPTGSGQFYHLVGVNNDVIMVGLDATTGKLLAAGGAMVVDNLGITFTGLNYFERFNATNAGNSRRFEIGTMLLDGSNEPVAYLALYDPTPNTNLQTNGDFELGALTDWTAADSGAPAWSAVTTAPQAGTYCAQLNTTGDTESNLQTNGNAETGDFTGWATGGTGTWTVVPNPFAPFTGADVFQLGATANQTGTLTTNLGATPRMAVTAGKRYKWTATVGFSSTVFSTHQLLIKWYTATSGGSLISTDTITLTSVGPGSILTGQVTAPATAAGAELVFNFVRNATAGGFVFLLDDVTFGESQSGTLTTNLGATPRMAVTAGNSYQAICYYKTDNALTTWNKANFAIKWYTATSGGNLISTNTAPVIPITSWNNAALVLTAPAGAVGAEIVLDIERGTSGQGNTNLFFDTISMALVTVSNSMQFSAAGPTVIGSLFNFKSLSSFGIPASGVVGVFNDVTFGVLRAVNSRNQNDLFHLGEHSGRAIYTNDAAAKDILRKTILANQLGLNGTITGHAVVRLINGASGSARNITIIASLGGTTLFSYSFTTAIGQNGSGVIELWVTVSNANSASSQTASLLSVESGGLIPGTGANAATVVKNGANTISVSTAANQDFAITGTMSAANANLSFEVLTAQVFGPINGA